MAEPPPKPSTALVRIVTGEGHTVRRMWSWVITDLAPPARQLEETVRAAARGYLDRLAAVHPVVDARSATEALQGPPLAEPGQAASEVEAREAMLIRRIASMKGRL